MKLDVDKLDFDRCEDEPIHIPEAIQGYGYLFALEENDGSVKIISENVKNLLKQEEEVIGKNFFDLLMDEEDTIFLKETHNRARRESARLPLRLRFKKELIHPDHANDFLAVVYDSDDLFVVELEPAVKFRETYSARHFIKLYAMSIAPKFKTFKSLGSMSQEIVDTIKYITDMERVVLYKFNPDGSGKVIAEAKEDDIESYLDVYYPPTDIPKQARELYKKNWVRLLPNTELEPSRLIPTVTDSGRKPLDMTHSILRDLSPIHRQYVRNQGLKASLSMSLVTHDILWGMISCHSRVTRYVPQNVRLECENLSQLFSWHLYAKEEELHMRKKDRIDQTITEMLNKTSQDNPIVEVFKQNEEVVLEIMEADGFMFFTETKNITLGTTPTLAAIREIYRKAYGRSHEPFVSDCVGDLVSDPKELNGIKGALINSLVEHKNYFTAWFRKEENRVEKWAGTPEEKDFNTSKRERLMPRTSFAIHEKRITGKSKPWNRNDVEVASRFNKVFMAHTLEMQDRMRQNITTLELENKYKNEFLATLAHELRNPLTPISTGINLLDLEKDKFEESKGVIEVMKRQVGYMTTMIDDLMDVSRITSGKVKLQREDHDIREILQGAINTCDHHFKEKGHNLVYRFPDEPWFVNGDRTRLTQIFINILHNAAKYTDNCGKIEVCPEKNDNSISIRIKDNGIGIPPQRIDTIFTMFTQVDDSTNNRGGLGIGLTLVQKLVDLHRGKIFVHSEGLGKGSEFEVLLPLATPKSLANGNKNENNSALSGRKILLVDDNSDVLAVVAMLLRKEGFDVMTAGSGSEALEVFKVFMPDCGIFDIGMPGMDGYELCRKLKETPEAKDVVFFSHSGWANKSQIEKAYESGFSEHMVKPLDMDKLRNAMVKHLAVS